MSESLIVIVYCGHYRRALLHPTDHESPSNECCFESRVKVDPIEWEEECVSMTCPSCGNTLYQGDDHFIEDDGRKYRDDAIIDLTITEG
ncbi:hypothetical protein SAMN02799624_05333 [Paenibacillus sp. UNC496MF]|uniref:hypothetical protein n=1 Tax=Paenibacillus sp. UNC496MF TaxID=1502753 RepID=UPI0008E0638F|nr:hypothetical protein [Paenibacillus sp. UNC496MF]SFJ64315.1 hypothetical protein SAMN02799624_05333 [Paenibacillus sp. UNC496MF]